MPILRLFDFFNKSSEIERDLILVVRFPDFFLGESTIDLPRDLLIRLWEFFTMRVLLSNYENVKLYLLLKKNETHTIEAHGKTTYHQDKIGQLSSRIIGACGASRKRRGIKTSTVPGKRIQRVYKCLSIKGFKES